MSSVLEILGHALVLPPEDRATIAQSLIQSLPAGLPVFRTEGELAAALKERLSSMQPGVLETSDGFDALRRAREAVRQVHQP